MKATVQAISETVDEVRTLCELVKLADAEEQADYIETALTMATDKLEQIQRDLYTVYFSLPEPVREPEPVNGVLHLV